MNDKVTRLEIIDEKGRAYTRWNIEIEGCMMQDDGRTMKIFIKPREETPCETSTATGDAGTAPSSS